MKTSTLKLKTASLLSLAFLIIISSCVNEEYDLKNLDKTINIGGENLSLPLGDTDSIKVMSLLDTEDIKKILKKTGADSNYVLNLEDVIDFSNSIPTFGTDLLIKGMTKHQVENFEIESVNQEKIVVEQQTITKNIAIELISINMSDLNLPSIEEHKDIKPVDKYKLDPAKMKLNLAPKPLTQPNLFKLKPEQITVLESITSSDPISIPDSYAANKNIPLTKSSIKVKLELPAGVSNIDDIKLNPNSKMNVRLEILNSVLSDGALIPNLTFDPSSLFVLKGGSSIIITEPLNSGNEYTFTKDYDITGLNITPTDWVENILDITKEVSMTGDISMNSVKVLKEKIGLINSMGIRLTITITDLEVTSVDFTIPKIEEKSTGSIELEMKPTDIPTQINATKTIIFKPGSDIKFSFAKKGMQNLTNLGVTLKSLKIKFPKEYKVQNANSNNEVLFNEPQLVFTGNEVILKIDVTSLDLSGVPLVNNTLSYKGSFTYEVELSVNGSITTAHLSDNPLLSMDVLSNLLFDHALVATSNMAQSIEDKIDIEFSFADAMDYREFKIKPKGDPFITINTNLPEVGLKITTDDQRGLEISLPKEFIFKDIPTEYVYNKANHSINLRGEIPKQIKLHVDSLLLNPTITPAGTSLITTEVLIKGGIVFNSGETTSDKISSAAGTPVTFEIIVPKIEPDFIEIEAFHFNTDQNFDIPIKIDGMEQVESIKTISAENADILFAIKLIKIPDFGGAPIQYDFKINFPKSFVFDDKEGRVDENNSISLIGTFKDVGDSLVIEGLNISNFNFEGKDLSGGIDFLEKISCVGKLLISKPTIGVNDLSGAKIEFDIKAGIKDFSPKKVIGTVDYIINDIREVFIVEGLPDFMKSKDFVLDVKNPYITMEVATNMGIPIDANVLITPWVSGSPYINGIKEFPIILPSSPESKTDTTKYWISGVEPTDGNYTFIESDLDSLIRKLPQSDSLVISLNAQTNKEKDHIIDLDATYNAQITYSVVAPLMFGEDLNISFSQVISDIPSIVTDLVKEGEITLLGEIENSLPLQLELSIKTISSDNVSTPISSGASIIAPCKSDGEKSISSIEITLDNADNKITDISSLELTFTINSPTLDVSINEDSYVKAKLKVKIPNGVTVDLDDSNDTKE